MTCTRSISKARSTTVCAGRSSAGPSSRPMVNGPPGIRIIAGGTGVPAIPAGAQSIAAAAKAVDLGRGVVLVTDMFGGTPSNLGISVMTPGKVEVLAGANVPMLIKLISVRDSLALLDAVMTAQEAGRKYINVASSLLKKAS